MNQLVTCDELNPDVHNAGSPQFKHKLDIFTFFKSTIVQKYYTFSNIHKDNKLKEPHTMVEM